MEIFHCGLFSHDFNLILLHGDREVEVCAGEKRNEKQYKKDNACV